MTLTEAIVSGIVQGLTEFLPISSSGHLVLVHGFFGFSQPGIFFDICLHVATLGAVVIYFGRDIIQLARQKRTEWLLYLAVGTVPAVLAALFFEDRITAFFTDTGKVGITLMATGLVLFAGEGALRVRKGLGDTASLKSSAAVGLAQALALLPGISRSGMTISTGLLSGMRTEEAFRFSFLLSIPAITGAVLYKGISREAAAAVSGNALNYAAGMFLAFVTGILSLRLLWWVLKRRRLYIFGAYCLVLGACCLFFIK